MIVKTKTATKSKATKRASKATKAGPVTNPMADKAAIAGLEAIEAAEGQALAATIDVFRASAQGATVTVAMIAKHWPSAAESSRGVYASEFSAARNVAAIIGEAGALKLIDDAAALPGRAKVNVLAALRDVRRAAREAGTTTATAAQARKLTAAAVKVAKANGKAVKVKAKAAEAKRVAKVQPRTAEAPASMKGAQPIMGPKSYAAALQVLISEGRRLSAEVNPARRLLWDEGVKALETAHESFIVAAK